VTAGQVSPELPAVLAVDGGNSKTDIALVAADGTLLAGGRGPGVRTFPTPEVLASIGAVIAAAALGARLPARWPVAAHTVACMANADLPQEEERLAGMIAAAGWSTTTEVANDTFAVLRAGLDTPGAHPWGVAVTCGAGINCVGVAPDGRTTGFLALAASPATGAAPTASAAPRCGGRSAPKMAGDPRPRCARWWPATSA